MTRKLLIVSAWLLLLLGLGAAAALCRYEAQLRAFYAASGRVVARPHQAGATEVFVLGTVHFPTVAFTADSLYNALETIRPDVILFEIDSTRLAEVFRRPPLGQRLSRALGLAAAPNESRAVAKYQRQHPAALVRPYEWGRRDQFHRQHHILTTPDLIYNQLAALRKAGQLTPRQQGILARYDSLTACLNALGRTQPLAALNSPAADSLTQRRQYCQYHQLKTIVDEHEALREFRAFYQVNERYWDIRNQAMSRNIARYVALYPGRRLVVLAGFNHRYYLRRELRQQEGRLHFQLRELVGPAAAAR